MMKFNFPGPSAAYLDAADGVLPRFPQLSSERRELLAQWLQAFNGHNLPSVFFEGAKVSQGAIVYGGKELYFPIVKNPE